MTIRLTPVLPTKVAMAQFRNVEDAVSAVHEILRTPHGMQLRTQKFLPLSTHSCLPCGFSECIELLDDSSKPNSYFFNKSLRILVMAAINAAGLISRPYPAQDTLFFKIQGDDTSINSTSQTIQSIVEKHGGLRFQFANTDQEAEELWQNRKYALMSSLAAYPGKRCWTTDVW